MPALTINDLHKSFGDTIALSGVTFEAEDGEILAVLGPSGCGKSTLLALIAGLDTPDRGSVHWDGEDLDTIPPHRRGFGLMFQDYALFPHMTVAANVAFGLEMDALPQPEIDRRVAEALDLVGLSNFEHRDVNKLSGGEQQRVALARSLAPRPRLLMLDEPLGSLDRALRERLLADLKAILSAANQTAIYVTHDQAEAFAVADRVVVMQAGAVAQIGTPRQIYRRPVSLFVAQFLGLTNLLSGPVRSQDGDFIADTHIGPLPIPETENARVDLLLRPDAVRIDSSGKSALHGTVSAHDFRGATTLLEVEIENQSLRFEFLSSLPLPMVGEPIHINYDPAQAVHILD